MKNGLKYFFLCLFLSVVFFYRAFTQHLLIAPGDGWLYHYPMRLYYAKMFLHHGIHWWFPWQFLGLPLLGTMQTGILYPLNWIYFLLPTPQAYNYSLILHYALGAYFMFLYVRLLGASTLASLLAGMTFAFPGFLMAHKQHTPMVDAAIWLPLILYFYEKIKRDLRMKDALWGGLAIAIQIFAGHFQMSFFTYLILLIFTLAFLPWQAGKNKLRFLTLCALPVCLGILIGLPQLAATRELAAQNFHAGLGLQTVVSESFPPYLLKTLIFPFYYGGYGVSYFAQGHLIEFLGFTGVLALAAAAVTIRNLRSDPQIRFWTIVALFALILMLGGNTPLAPFLAKIPILHSFRLWARNIFELDVSIAVLFGIGFDRCMQNTQNRQSIKIFLLLLLFLECCMLAWNPPPTFTLSSPSFWIPAVFTLFYFLWFSWEKYRPSGLAAFLLLGAVFAECFLCQSAFDAEWPPIDAHQQFMAEPAIRYIAKNIGENRFAYYGNFEAFSYAGIPIVNSVLRARLLNGYDPLVPLNTQELIGAHYLGYLYQGELLFHNNLILSLLATRYILFPRNARLDDLARLRASSSRTALETVLSDKDEFTLRSSDGKRVSVKKMAVPFIPGGAYEISLETKSDDELSAQLVFDLYSPDFHNDQSQLFIFPAGISNRFQRYYKFIFLPHKIQTPLYARIYTFSKKPIEVKNIDIKVIRDYRPFWMKKAPNFPGAPIYKPVFQSKDFIVFENRNALPRLFSIQNLSPVNSIDEMKESLYLLRSNPGRTAFLEPDDYKSLSGKRFSTGAIKDFKEDTDDIEARVRFPGNGFLILSDQYFPGWKAFVDGKETKIYRVDGALRGIEAPPSEHKIEFRYQPVKIYLAGGIGLLTLIGVCAGLVMKRKSWMSPL